MSGEEQKFRGWGEEESSDGRERPETQSAGPNRYLDGKWRRQYLHHACRIAEEVPLLNTR